VKRCEQAHAAFHQLKVQRHLITLGPSLHTVATGGVTTQRHGHGCAREARLDYVPVCEKPDPSCVKTCVFVQLTAPSRYTSGCSLRQPEIGDCVREYTLGPFPLVVSKSCAGHSAWLLSEKSQTVLISIDGEGL
jgi:hypothetical protein